MFPEYRDLITQLKTSDRHFLQLFNRHNGKHPANPPSPSRLAH